MTFFVKFVNLKKTLYEALITNYVEFPPHTTHGEAVLFNLTFKHKRINETRDTSH